MCLRSLIISINKIQLIVKESQRLVAEYEKLFDGSAWIDVNIMDTLKPLSAIAGFHQNLSGMQIPSGRSSITS
jgi:hypothetical protein